MGPSHFAQTIRAIRHRAPGTTIEVLTPDERFHDLDAGETARHFDALITLYDHPENEVTSRFLADGRMDRERLVSASMIAKKGRQDILLIDDADQGTVEVDVALGEKPGTVRRTGPFGEGFGTGPASEGVVYSIQRD